MKRILYFLPIALAVLAARSCGGTSQPAAPPALKINTLASLNGAIPTKATATASRSSAGSAADSQPMPALSSDNAAERLQVVRQAHNKWGGSKVARDKDRFAIVGRWNYEYPGGGCKIFNADGTFTFADWLTEIKGAYRFLSSNEIEFTYPGMLYGENVMRVEYRLLGDTLELKTLGLWFTYNRATP
ncbi:MAG: hypothetical protein ACRELF_22675 [Gemmataceae bacterium]